MKEFQQSLFFKTTIYLVLILTIGYLTTPFEIAFSDEIVFYLTAQKFLEIKGISSFIHFSKEFMISGLENNPIHPVFYQILLAIWSCLFLTSSSVIYFNIALFAIFLSLVDHFYLEKYIQCQVRLYLARITLLCTPLGLSYAFSGMMEVLVLVLTGVALHLAYRPISRVRHLFYNILLWCLCIATRPTIFFSIAPFFAFRKDHKWGEIIYEMKRDSFKGTLFIFSGGLFLFVSWFSLFMRGEYPSLINNISSETFIQEIFNRIKENHSLLFSWNSFPHDVFDYYFLLLFLIPFLMVVLSNVQRSLWVRIATSWIFFYFFTYSLYAFSAWRSSRLFMAQASITLIALFIFPPSIKNQKKQKYLLTSFAFLHILLAYYHLDWIGHFRARQLRAIEKKSELQIKEGDIVLTDIITVNAILSTKKKIEIIIVSEEDLKDQRKFKELVEASRPNYMTFYYKKELEIAGYRRLLKIEKEQGFHHWIKIYNSENH